MTWRDFPVLEFRASARISWRAFLVLLGLFGLILPSFCFASTSIPFTINFSEPVVVIGTPQLNLTVGSTARQADYASGSSTSTLTFTYTTQPGDLDLDGIALSASLDLTNGTVKDMSGNTVTPLTFSAPTTTGIKVDHPSLALDLINNDYIYNSSHYASLASFLSAVGGSFQRNSIATYFDASGVMQTAVANSPRFDYHPTTHVARGLLMEESRTNSIRNGNVTGSVSGTPGTLPTNWGIGGGGLGTLTQQVVGSGTENGIPYVDFRIFGTASVSSFFLYLENATAIVASSGQKWTSSMYAKIAAGALSNVSFQHIIYERNAAGGALVSGNSAFAVTATLTRFTFTRTLVNASTARLVSALQANTTVGQPIDITLRIGGVQLEQGSFVTSYIPTTNAAVTRSSDSLSIPSAGWVGGSTETVYFQADAVLPQTTWLSFFSHNLNFTNNRYLLLSSSGNVTAGYSGVNISTAGAATSNTVFKAGGSFGTSNTYAALNGVVTSGAASSNGTDVNTGIGISSTSSINGHLRLLKYYPLDTSSTQLQLLTQ